MTVATDDKDRRVLLAVERDERASLDEIAAAAQLSSRSAALYALRRLAARGYVELAPKGQKRSLRLLRPSSAYPAPEAVGRKRSAAELLDEAAAFFETMTAPTFHNLNHYYRSKFEVWLRDYERWKK